MYKSPPVQSFLYGLSSKELHQDKLIYKHGTLRLVRTSCISRYFFQLRSKNKVLGTLRVSLSDLGDMSLNEINNNHNLMLLCSEDARVDTYDGLMSTTCKLIHTGEFANFSDTQTLVSQFCPNLINMDYFYRVAVIALGFY